MEYPAITHTSGAIHEMELPPCFAGAEVDFDAVVAVGLVSAMIVFFRVELLGFKLKTSASANGREVKLRIF
jgi:hypothetical protein